MLITALLYLTLSAAPHCMERCSHDVDSAIAALHAKGKHKTAAKVARLQKRECRKHCRGKK